MEVPIKHFNKKKSFIKKITLNENGTLDTKYRIYNRQETGRGRGGALGGTTCAVKCVHRDILTPLQSEWAECTGGRD